MFFVQGRQKVTQVLKDHRIAEVAGDIVNALREPVPLLRIELGCREVSNFLVDHVPEFVRGHFVPGHAHQREVLGEQVVFRQVIKCGDELALGEIAGRAKDHHHARIAWTPRIAGAVS